MLIYGRSKHNIVIILQLKVNKLRKKKPYAIELKLKRNTYNEILEAHGYICVCSGDFTHRLIQYLICFNSFRFLSTF